MKTETYSRVSVSREMPDWLPVGDTNELTAVLRDCSRGKAGTVVARTHKQGAGNKFDLVGTCEYLGATPGHAIWGDSPCFAHRILTITN
jgi:hypothetical protein